MLWFVQGNQWKTVATDIPSGRFSHRQARALRLCTRGRAENGSGLIFPCQENWVWLKIEKLGLRCVRLGFHVPGFHFGYPLLTHSQLRPTDEGIEHIEHANTKTHKHTTQRKKRKHTHGQIKTSTESYESGKARAGNLAKMRRHRHQHLKQHPNTAPTTAPKLHAPPCLQSCKELSLLY